MKHLDYLFVYGTLRRGFGGTASSVLAGKSIFVGMASIPGKLYDLGAYPGVKWLPAHSATIRGEIYLLRDPENTLNLLDDYEGFTGLRPLFARERAVAVTGNGRTLQVQFYHYTREVSESKRIESGDYLEFLKACTL